MIPSNFIPAGPARKLRQVNYTDDTPSREVEEDSDDDWGEEEELKKFKEGFAYRKPSILNVRDGLNDLLDLIEVTAVSLMCTKPYVDVVKAHNILQIHVIPKMKELEKELAKL